MSEAKHNLSFAAHLARALSAGGVEHVIVSPGSRSTPLVLAFADRPELQLHCILDERSAAFFALGIARITGRPATLICTSGSAGAHYLPALIEASESQLPLVVLTADRPPELHGSGAWQTIDQGRLFGTHCRFFEQLGAAPQEQSPERLRRVVARALDAATLPPAGPVHLNIPFREPLWQAGLSVPRSELTPARILRPRASADEALIEALRGRLNGIQRGVIVAGLRQRAEPGFAAAVSELARHLAWPLLAQVGSGLSCDSADQNITTVTTTDALLRDEDFCREHAPEAILFFGRTPCSKLLLGWLERHGRDRLVLVHPGAQWNDPSLGADLLIAADETSLCQGLRAALTDPRRDPAWLASWQRAEAATRAVLDAACGDGFWEGAIAKAVMDALPAGAALHVANSMPVRDVDAFAAPSHRSIRVLANRGANGIDGTLSTALGEAMARPDDPMVLLCGDLALLHDSGGLVAAGQLGLPITIVVINNGGGGIFGFLPIAAHRERFERFFLTPQDMDIPALCRAAGLRCQSVASLEELRAGLRAELAATSAGVIELRVDRQANLARHREVWREVSHALAETRRASEAPCR